MLGMCRPLLGVGVILAYFVFIPSLHDRLSRCTGSHFNHQKISYSVASWCRSTAAGLVDPIEFSGALDCEGAAVLVEPTAIDQILNLRARDVTAVADSNQGFELVGREGVGAVHHAASSCRIKNLLPSTVTTIPSDHR